MSGYELRISRSGSDCSTSELQSLCKSQILLLFFDNILGEFGNEGSGGQSYLVYPWKSGQVYRFLVRATPQAESNSTIFTCEWYA